MTLTSLKSTNLELTDAIRTYVEEKLEMLEKLTTDFEPAAEISVEVGKTTNHHQKGQVFRAEMMLQIPGQLIRAESTREDLYEAIDTVKDDLKRQLNDYRERLHDHKKAVRPGKE